MIPAGGFPGMLVAAVGIVVALAALALDDRRVTWIAIVVLSAALVMRLLDRRRGDHDHHDGGDVGGADNG